MVVSLTRFSWWIWGRKERELVSNGSSLNPSTNDYGAILRENDSVTFPSRDVSSHNRKVKRKWHGREERRTEKQCGDMVLIQSDGGGGVYLSGSEYDGVDWSIGWVEPHGRGFKSDDEADNGFSVLVSCYRSGCKELVEGSNKQLLGAIKNFPNEFSSDGKN